MGRSRAASLTKSVQFDLMTDVQMCNEERIDKSRVNYDLDVSRNEHKLCNILHNIKRGKEQKIMHQLVKCNLRPTKSII